MKKFYRINEELGNTVTVIDTIKEFIRCNNIINSTKINFPGRELSTELSEEGREYRLYLNQYCDCLSILKKEMPEMGVLSDLKEYFPEIDCYFKSGHCFYTWNNVIL